MDLGSVTVIALVAGLAGGAVGVAILHDEQGFGAQLLIRLGVTPERVRAAVGH